MSDKEKIIHGVDVSKCEFYDKDKGYCLTLKMNPKGFKNPSCFSGDFQECIQENKICPNTFCHNNSNCYYKQLSRKTQEYEELKRKVELMMDCPDCKVDEYKKALEEIEEIIKSSTKDFSHIDWEAKASHALTAVDKISDIINKAKDGNDEENNKR